ncbi:MAG TPA: hypothetical protein VLJ57_07620 [Burkholderiaceae bacterium]|nr:hypothetical protein [Burkholderiaceae bacterium]
MLTVFANGAHRSQVQDACTGLAPGSRVSYVSTPTEAVLALLSERVDLVLVDVAVAADLLPALALHARRSLPQATLLCFGDAAAQGRATSAETALHKVFPWEELVPVLTRWLQAWQALPA